jgi:hypothetical protein
MSINQKYIILALEIFFLIFFIWFTYYGGFIIGGHFDEGWIISEDGNNFIQSAKLYKEYGLSIFIKSELARQASLNYIVTIILIANLMASFNDWLLVFIGINLTLFFLSYFILKNFLFKQFLNQQNYFFLNLILIFIYFSNYENYFYTRFVLADCFFSFCTLLLFLKLNSGRRSNVNNFFIFLIAILIFFINPKFIAVLFYLIFYLLIKLLIIKNSLINKKNLGISLIFFYLFGQLLWAILYVNYDFINYLKGDIFLEIKNFYLDGTIIYKKTNIDYLLNEISIIKIFYLGILRSISFFQFWSIEWDLKHNLVNTISIMPLYLSNVFNIYNFKNYTKINKKIIISVVAMTLAFTVMASITAVDHDWRYRYPLYTILMIGLIIFFKEKNFKILKF